MKDCDLSDRVFKTAVLKKLNETEENSERQFNELRNKIKEQKEYFTKVQYKSETIKRNQTEILELKNSINEMNELASLGNRADQIEERISDTEDRNIEMTLVEEERESKVKKN